ncbi:hypothetical protein V8G54_035779 [Vigna mungo]|uniref:Uncharacterized protein n=1 Tax=Vigna mungo TaxID=3915 RepID=A0AAQ3RFZ3_VIGMU
MGQLNQRRNQSEQNEKQRNPGSTASVLTQKTPQIHSRSNTKYEIEQPINTATPIGEAGIADDVVAVVVEEDEVEGVVEVGVVELVVVEVVGVSLVLSESEGGESLAGEGAAAESETFLALTLTASFMPP